VIKLLSQSKYKAHKSAEKFIHRRQHKKTRRRRRKEEEDAGEAGLKRYGCTASSSVYSRHFRRRASRWTFRSSDAICIDLRGILRIPSWNRRRSCRESRASSCCCRDLLKKLLGFVSSTVAIGKRSVKRVSLCIVIETEFAVEVNRHQKISVLFNGKSSIR